MIFFRAKHITITSALPYVNGVKHLGNLTGSILPSDVFHRFLKLQKKDHVFICGTDDHGTPTEIAAHAEGLPFDAYAAKYHAIQQEIYKKWHIDFTFFGRSSSPSNHLLTREFFLSSHENGYILKHTLTIPFCTTDQRFLPDRYIIGFCPHCGYDRARGDQCEKCSALLDPQELKEPRCSICNSSSIIFKDEKHLFLDLPALQNKLGTWIDEQTHWPENTKRLAQGWIQTGLKPRCITRNLQWGIPVPLKGFEHLVFYVWYDAPIAYLSITRDAFEEGRIAHWKPYWKDSLVYHFVGKDNIPFHTIFWPAILLAARDSEVRDTNYQLPHVVQGYDYLNWEGEKFSTSQGRGLFSDEALDLFPVDYWRFYLLSILPETKDSNFSWDDFAARINNELIANYGNLFYRVTHFIQTYFDGVIPEPHTGETETQLFHQVTRTKHKVAELVQHVKLREALAEILALAKDINKYFQDQQPWDTIKTDKDAAATTIFTAVNVLRSITVLLWPYIPQTSERALHAINAGNTEFDRIDELQLRPGEPAKAVLLFKKIESQELDNARAYRSKYAGPTKNLQDETLTLVDDMLPIDEFRKVELKIGTITTARNHPNADKLVVLLVDLGNEQRQIVAGLRPKYKAEELEGMQVVVVANLQEKELKGVKSRGMLLAAEDGTLLAPGRPVPDGAKVM